MALCGLPAGVISEVLYDFMGARQALRYASNWNLILIRRRRYLGMTALKQALFDEYGFADKRYKKLSSSNIFAIDGRRPSDVASNGQFYGWFCSVFVDTSSDPVITVRFFNNIPYSPEVRTWIQKYQATYAGAPQETLEFTVAPGEQQKLLELAEAFENIVKPGRRYETPAYKHICPRLGRVIRHFESILTSQWGGA